jgi:ABC-type branched-subunit amino acid transport system substrate-binding protein
MRRAAVIVVAGFLVAGAACRKHEAGQGRDGAPRARVAVDAPFATEPSVARAIERGARLAADEINAAGGVNVNGRRVRMEIIRFDNQLSPSTAVSDTRHAVERGAVALITDGTGAEQAGAVDTGLPVAVMYRGDAGLVDRTRSPNVFRIAPTNRAVAFRLAEYLVPKGLRIGLLHDDSGYGAGGVAALDAAFARNRSSVSASLAVSASGDPAPQIHQLRDSGSNALVVWGRPGTVAAAIRAARQAGWTVPVFSAPSGEDPFVRQQLADHPEWLEGTTVVMSRLTSEKGPAPFERFRQAYEARFGREQVGVRSHGRPVVQAPDWGMYPYDFVRLVAAAMARSGSFVRGEALVKQLEQVSVEGANGDERGFNERNHEGVVDDDVFFAAIRSMILVPVKDDPLSATLPTVSQTE